MGITTQQPTLRKNESGMAAILITMVTMIVISLIVLGFAAVSTREQRQTLDQQLSTQAFYAAETGVNDVVNLEKQQTAVGKALPAKTSCTNYTQTPYNTLNPTIDATHDVSYTCLLVNPNPTELDFNDIGTNSTVVPLISGNGNPLYSVTLTWQSKDGSKTPINGCPSPDDVKNGDGGGDLTKASDWSCGYGILRYDIVRTTGTTLTQQSLQSSTMTRFMVPTNAASGTTVPFATTGNPAYATTCTNTQCKMTLYNLNGTEYYLRLASLYKDSSLQITAEDNTGATDSLTGSQVMVDATGKAQDVLRRIQVHVSVSNTNQNAFPENALESNGSICKRFAVMDGYFQNMITNISDSSNSLCTP